MKKITAAVFALLALSFLCFGLAARDNCTVEAPYFNVKPNIDGVITAAEWGQPTAYAIVYTGRSDYKYDDDDNVLTSDYCFCDPRRAMYVNDCSFDLWLRWDEQYFYIGVVSKDKYGLAANWNPAEEPEWYYIGLFDGDALQFGIDPAGANSGGDPSNPFLVEFPYNTFVFGWPDRELSKPVLRNDADMSKLCEGYKANITWNPGVWPSFGGQPNSDPGYTTYELAIPYALFKGNVEEGKTNGFGVTVARVSATPADAVDQDGNIVGCGENDMWLTWGDGIMGSLKDQLPEFRGGSNSVLLTDTPAVGAGAADAPAVIAPEADEPEQQTSEPEENGDAEEAESSAEGPEEGEEITEETTAEATAEAASESAEETAEDTAAEELTEEAEAAEDEEAAENGGEGSEGSEKSEETGAASGDKAAADNGEEKSALPVILIAAAAVVVAAVVIVLLAKKKKN